jgi:hypothetical protein
LEIIIEKQKTNSKIKNKIKPLKGQLIIVKEETIRKVKIITRKNNRASLKYESKLKILKNF